MYKYSCKSFFSDNFTRLRAYTYYLKYYMRLSGPTYVTRPIKSHAITVCIVILFCLYQFLDKVSTVFNRMSFTASTYSVSMTFLKRLSTQYSFQKRHSCTVIHFWTINCNKMNLTNDTSTSGLSYANFTNETRVEYAISRADLFMFK